ncbi:MAG: choice-of-anchor D domain-containing protein, partial [Bacteroidetes bacterium]|nr:choice-of-anchor D domain-containing protein [Bacteroidota bacterium]
MEWYKVEVVAYYAAYSTFQVRLYEAGGRIEFIYPQLTNVPTCNWCNGCTGLSTTASMGLSNGSNNYLSVTPTGGTSATASGSSANNSINLASVKFNANVMLVFQNVPNVQLSATPKSIDVGAVSTGNYVDYQVTVKHAGTEGKLKVNSATLVGDPDFSVIGALPDSLGIGQSATITVRFAPQTSGARAATLTLTSNGLDSGTQQVTFKGIGLAPFIGVDTTILFKKTLTKLGQSSTGRILISSTAIPTLILNNFTITGIDADQYSIARYPASALPGGTSDTLVVQYTPTREGRRTATLNISSNAINTPVVQISLIGTGILPHIVVSPNPMRFDSTALGDTVCKTLSVYNPGSDTLVLVSNSMPSSDGDFTYAQITGTDVRIPPDKTRNVNVCFRPLQAGTRQGTIVLKTNIIPTFETPRRDTAGTVIIPVMGSAVAYGGLSISSANKNILDTAIVGTQVCVTDTIRNTGGADVVIRSLNLSGTNATEFTVSGITLPYTLKIGSFVVVNVCTTPTQRGLRTATLTLSGTSSGKTVGSTSTLNTLGIRTCLSPSPNELFSGFLIY